MTSPRPARRVALVDGGRASAETGELEMQAAVVEVFGGPENLVLREVAEPRPGRGEVAVRVDYAGVNYLDVMQRRGEHTVALPFVPGIEVAGSVHAIGPDVEGLAPGQRAVAFTSRGGYAEVALAPAPLVLPLPDVVTLEQAAGGLTVAATALAALRDVARMRPGERVVVHGARGGLGSVAGQVARALGAGTVLGTVRRRAAEDDPAAGAYDDIVESASLAEWVMGPRGPGALDVVLDPVGGPTFDESFDLLAPLGRIVRLGNASRAPEAERSTLSLIPPSQGILGFSITGLAARAPDRLRTIAQDALQLIAEGRVRLSVSERWPLREAAQAHSRPEACGASCSSPPAMRPAQLPRRATRLRRDPGGAPAGQMAPT